MGLICKLCLQITARLASCDLTTKMVKVAADGLNNTYLSAHHRVYYLFYYSERMASGISLPPRAYLQMADPNVAADPHTQYCLRLWRYNAGTHACQDLVLAS